MQHNVLQFTFLHLGLEFLCWSLLIFLNSPTCSKPTFFEQLKGSAKLLLTVPCMWVPNFCSQYFAWEKVDQLLWIGNNAGTIIHWTQLSLIVVFMSDVTEQVATFSRIPGCLHLLQRLTAPGWGHLVSTDSYSYCKSHLQRSWLLGRQLWLFYIVTCSTN